MESVSTVAHHTTRSHPYDARARKAQTLYGTYIDEPLAKIESGSTLYYHCNRKYDVAGLTDSTGNIVELYAYTPYGTQTVLDATGTDISLAAQNNPYGFTGRRYDEETSLWYFRARYFDSALGRFISRDPIGYVDGMSLYAGYFALKWGIDSSGLRGGTPPGTGPNPPGTRGHRKTRLGA